MAVIINNDQYSMMADEFSTPTRKMTQFDVIRSHIKSMILEAREMILDEDALKKIDAVLVRIDEMQEE